MAKKAGSMKKSIPISGEIYEKLEKMAAGRNMSVERLLESFVEETERFGEFECRAGIVLTKNLEIEGKSPELSKKSLQDFFRRLARSEFATEKEARRWYKRSKRDLGVELVGEEWLEELRRKAAELDFGDN